MAEKTREKPKDKQTPERISDGQHVSRYLELERMGIFRKPKKLTFVEMRRIGIVAKRN